MKRINIWLTVGMIGILVLSAANLWSIWDLSKKVEYLAGEVYARRSLPCQAIPIKFAMDNPECANQLLESMNVTNVRILPRGNLSSMNNYNITSLPEIHKRYNGT